MTPPEVDIEDHTEKNQEQQSPLFSNVYEFVDKLILPLYGLPKTLKPNWSDKWWAHPEAVIRLEALWLRFEALRREEPVTFMETFLRIHADYHMDRLMYPQGVFSQCRKEDVPASPLPSSPIPRKD